MTRERMPDGSTVTCNERGEVGGVYVGGDTWAAWEAERRRSLAADRAARPARLVDLEAKLARAGLRPVTDRELGLVRADCPDCRADESDHCGLYRPLVVLPRAGKLLLLCESCGIEEVRRV